MTERELLFQLNNLNQKKIDQAWLSSNRDILVSQILAGEQLEKTSVNWANIIWNMTSGLTIDFVARPVFAVAVMIILVLAGGTVVSIKASENAKPGDSLYIAKMISEQTRASLTFNEKDKAKLNVEFAGNRVKELTQVLSAPSQNKEEQTKHVEQLANNFKQELSEARDRLSKINFALTADDGKSEKTGTVSPSTNVAAKSPEKKIASQPAAKNAKPAQNQIFGANLEKSNSGMQISDPALEAENLFNKKDYDGAINKLNEVHKIIESNSEDKKAIKADVIKEKESATSTK